MMRAALLAAAFAAALGVVAEAQGPQRITVTLPAPLVNFKDGPNVNVVRANCLVCHGADYVYNQPPLSRAQWTAEVAKMRNAYKAQIADADAGPIVDYLMSQNGKQ